MNPPDVSVIVAVYNTMPYLTECLNSLVDQSIGAHRMEIIAIDDGSTDGGDKELDRYAELYPGTFTVVHQANSGGPAQPQNQGLDRARGRYVFFIGADDYLGREALARMVAMADGNASDVVLGRMVGVNGRYVHQAVFASTRTDIGLYDSPLPWSLSNAKLFRRTLVERHHLRYPENLSVGSDQFFTLEACVHAGRISVLADYDYYYAVRRHDASNITYRTGHEARLRCTGSIMDLTARLVPAGEQRDAITIRHFSWELAKLLQTGFLDLDGEAQQRVAAAIGHLVGRYASDAIRARLDVGRRLRFALAECGALDTLRAVIRADTEGQPLPIVVDRGRAYLRYPGFRGTFPDDWFALNDSTATQLVRSVTALSAGWEPHPDGVPALTLMMRCAPADLTALGSESIRVTVAGVRADVTLTPQPHGAGTTIRARFPVDLLLAGWPGGGRSAVLVRIDAFGANGATALKAPGVPAAPARSHRRGARLFVMRTANRDDRLVVVASRVTPRRILRRLRNLFPTPGRSVR